MDHDPRWHGLGKRPRPAAVKTSTSCRASRVVRHTRGTNQADPDGWRTIPPGRPAPTILPAPSFKHTNPYEALEHEDTDMPTKMEDGPQATQQQESQSSQTPTRVGKRAPPSSRRRTGPAPTAAVPHHVTSTKQTERAEVPKTETSH